MAWRILILLMCFPLLLQGELPEIDLPADLEAPRREFIEHSLKALEEHPAIPYVFAGSCPEDGGMDCSGTVFYLLGLVGLDPPRSAQNLHDWINQSDKLVTIPAGVTKADDPAFAKMLPGDLLFWGTPAPDGSVPITHVEIYLGREKKDGRRVMIGSSDGRSYRGVKKNGFDIVDFQVPKADSPKRLVAYGPPVWEDRKKEPRKRDVPRKK